MAKKDPQTKGHGDSELWTCHCWNLISSRVPHQVCSKCLGLEHAHQAVDYPGSCRLCSVFTMKSLCGRLARQVSLSGLHPCLPSICQLSRKGFLAQHSPLCNNAARLKRKKKHPSSMGPLAAGNHSGRSSIAVPGCGPTLPPAGGSPAPRTNPPTAEMQEVAFLLTLRSERWVDVTASSWVVRAITKGYRLQFASMPPHFAGIIH